MLTFFRRIRKGLLEGDATRKYMVYAVGEIALVVIGILIALQINNWNEWRKDRNKEKLLLSEINKEFLFNKNELEETINFYRQIGLNCQATIKMFPIDLKAIHLDSISDLLVSLQRTPTADLSMGSINSLINDSSFDIITNNELRSLLLQWEDFYSDYQEREKHIIDFTIDYLIPYFIAKVPQPFNKGIRDARVDLSFLSSVEFENIVQHKYRWIRNMLIISEREENGILDALQDIIRLSGNIEMETY